MVEMGVTHLIDATNIPGKKKLPGIAYMDIEVEDTEYSNISSYFDEAVRFINDAREKGSKVIVYCCAGISRSAAICMMYLVMQEGLTLRKAYYEVERARLGIQPNRGFWRQMIDYEKRHNGGQTTIEMLNARGKNRWVPDVYLAKK